MDRKREERLSQDLNGIYAKVPLDRKLMIISSQESFGEQQLKVREVDSFQINNYLQARYWLEKADKGLERLPWAILCDIKLSKAGDYSLLNVIAQSPWLSSVPFISIGDTKSEFEAGKALRLGIDDHYELPLEWGNLLDRINFLHRLKTAKFAKEKALELEFTAKLPWQKRTFDVLVSGLLILLFSPLMMLIALLIKLSSKGPVMYHSQRAGAGYKIFDFYKFRSMRCGAAEELNELIHLNQYEGKTDENQAFVKLDGDPRITRIGRVLRDSSLDELPQLFNVFKGDMSIVGNRPLPLYEAEQLTSDHTAGRFLAPAGITGLWQISKRGKSQMSAEERIALDIEYSKRSSLWFDFGILLKTLPAIFQQESV